MTVLDESADVIRTARLVLRPLPAVTNKKLSKKQQKAKARKAAVRRWAGRLT